MIAKKGWFGRRKYLGWGFYPSAWQGWVYVGVLIAVVAGIQFTPLAKNQTGTLVVEGIIVILALIDILMTFSEDEREVIHEALAERNAMWVMLMVLALGLIYQAAQSSMTNAWQVDPVILLALAAALAVKAASNIYFDRKD